MTVLHKLAAMMGGASALLMVGSAWAAGDFSRSCWDIDLINNSFLDATCRTRQGNEAQTGIQLNSRIANLDGRLSWQSNGNYRASSQNCELDFASGQTHLHCDTQRRDGSWTSSSLNLDEHIANIDGQLTYER